MSMQNLFGNLALDESVQALIVKIVEVAVAEGLRNSLNAPRGLQYAKTASDQMRVNVDNGTINTLGGINMWNSGIYANYYASGGVQSVDKRHQQAELANANMYSVRIHRWKFT